MTRRLTPAILLFSLVAVLGRSVATAEASRATVTDDDGGGTVCSIAGSVAPSPGVGYAPQSGTYSLTGTMDCSSNAPSHATVTGTGTGTIGCLGGSSTAVLTVAWDNSQTSTMKVQLGDFTYGTGGFGTVDDGQFKGSHVGLGWGREAAAAEMRCATGGVKSYEFAGGVMIGSFPG